MVIFAAHWCPHCQREIPIIQDWVDGGGLPDDVDIVTVSTGIEPTAPNYPPEAWFEREGWTAPVIVDETGSVAQAYGLASYPYFVILDGERQRGHPARRRDPDRRTRTGPRGGAAELTTGHRGRSIPGPPHHAPRAAARRERGFEALQQRDLGRLDPDPRLGRVEPTDPVDLRDGHDPAGLRRPLEIERVRPCHGRIQVAFDRPRVDDLAALLDDGSQLEQRPVGERVAGLLGELAPRDIQQRFVPVRFALGDRPGSRVALGEERSTRVGEEHLEAAGGRPVEEDAGTRSRRHAGHGTEPRYAGPARTSR